jgi:Ca2+-binding RTX toxin-like protein
MPTVTVAGASGQTVTLSFDTNANAVLAQKLAAAITAGVQAGSILPASSTEGPPPALPPGKTGEYIQENDGLTILPHGYKAVVDTAQEAVIFGSGDADESVLSSTGNLNFFATGGSGTVAAGGGDNRIVIPETDKGNWSINTGNGDDTVLATGGGHDTINAGGGHNAIMLGSGSYDVQSTGDDTVTAGSGHETIAAIGKHRELIYGNSSQLFFVDTSGSATVFGGAGSDTFFGGRGPDLVYGGTGGNNLLFAGTGAATLYGGGNDDQLYAAGDKRQALHAGGGNETLNGAFASGADTFYGGSGAAQITGGAGNDTFVAGTGTATVTAGLSNNVFVFTNGQAGGTELIQGFASGQDTIDLQGYGKNEVTKALKSQVVANGSDTITLSDHTMITFVGVSSLSASDFVTSAGGAAGGSSADPSQGSGKGHSASQDDVDVRHIRDATFGSSDH